MLAGGNLSSITKFQCCLPAVETRGLQKSGEDDSNIKGACQTQWHHPLLILGNVKLHGAENHEFEEDDRLSMRYN